MQVYNNITRELEKFEPVNPGKVFIYSCGPTVYDHSHIGHARSALAWDILARHMKFKGYEVTWMRNITNVDDKIVARAKEKNISSDTLSREFTFEFWNDMSALNVSWPEFEPRATDYIQHMIRFIEELIDKGFAYEAKGDVYFRVEKHKSYGSLKGQSLEELAEGLSRVEANPLKENQLDFALWKNFEHEPETSFKSPWGIGRPGWHLECSTMIKSILEEHNAGATLDIHCGGDDLMHPHHDNECAQSECLSGQPLAKYWMHNGMIMINGKKMSKSENNFLTIKDLLARYKANAIRYFCLNTHYKKQINFTHEALTAAEAGFDKLYNSIKDDINLEHFQTLHLASRDVRQTKNLDQDLIAQFTAAMDEDLATAKALAILFENKDKAETVAYLLTVLGFDLINHTQQSSGSDKSDKALDAAMQVLIRLRAEARANKDFATSDLIRDELAKAGVQIKDHRDKPTEWLVG